MDYNYRSPLEGNYEDQGPYNSYGSNRYSPYAERSQGSTSRGSMYEQKPSQGKVGNQSYGRGSSEPSTSRPKYSDQFKQPSYPKELSDLMGALECKLCAVEVPSPIVAKMHYSGKQHAKKIKKFLMEYSLKTGCPMPEIEPLVLQTRTTVLANYCELCDVRLISESDKMLHFTGAKHRKNASDPANAKRKNKAYETIDLNCSRFGIGESFSSNSTDLVPYDEGKIDKTQEEFVCEMCDVKAVSQQQLQAHLSGKKHKEKLEKKNSLVPKAERPFKCTLCEVSLETNSLLKLHLAGKRHLKTVLKLEAKSPEAQCEICDVTFPSLEHYEMHMKGKKHEKKCRQNYNSAIEVKDEKVSVVCKFCPYVGSLDNHRCDYSLVSNQNMDIKKKFVCEPCHNMVFDSEEQLNEHKNSRRHFHCVMNFQQGGDKIVEELKHYYCFLCKKQSHSFKEYTEHFFEQTHMTLSREALEIDGKTDLFQCTVCDILMDSQTKEEHVRDRKHLKAALEKDTMKALSILANDEITNTSFYCTNCNVTLVNFMNYSTHVLSNEHMDKMITAQLSS